MLQFALLVCITSATTFKPEDYPVNDADLASYEEGNCLAIQTELMNCISPFATNLLYAREG